MTTCMITDIDTVRVDLDYEQLIEKYFLEIATNAGTVEFGLRRTELVKIRRLIDEVVDGLR